MVFNKLMQRLFSSHNLSKKNSIIFTVLLFVTISSIFNVQLNAQSYIKQRLEESIDKGYEKDPLIIAIVKDSSLTSIEKIINSGEYVNKSSSDNNTYPLHLAIDIEDINLSSLLLKYGAEVNKYTFSPFYYAVRCGNIDIIKLLIKNGANVNYQDSYTPNYSSLMRAVSDGNMDIARLLIENGANPNLTCIKGETALMLAAWNGREDLYDLLIKSGAEITIQNKFQENILMAAAYGGLYKAVSELISRYKFDVNKKDKNNHTPLIHAANGGNFDIVKLLIENGAIVHSTYKEQSILDKELSILNNAAKSGHVEMYKYLLKQGAPYNQEIGQEALEGATKNGHLEMMLYFLDNGFDVQTKLDYDGKLGGLLLSIAVDGGYSELVKAIVERIDDINNRIWGLGYQFPKSAKENYTEIVLTFLKYGANPNFVYHNEDLPLFHAIKNNNSELVLALLKHGANINGKDKYGNLPIIFANDSLIIEHLLKYGADINTKNSEGDPKIILALRYENVDIAKLLIAKGAEINVHDSDGASILLSAIKSGDEKLSLELIDKGVDIHTQGRNEKKSLLMIAIEAGMINVAEQLINKGVDINYFDDLKSSALSCAIVKKNSTIALLLINKGIILDSPKKNALNYFILAAEHGLIDVMETLLKKGVDVNGMPSYPNTTALMEASNKGEKEAVQWLIDHGADINQKPQFYSNMALDYAINSKHDHVAYILIENGADINKDGIVYNAIHNKQFELAELLIKKGAKLNGYGWTPLMEATKQGDFELIKLLVEHGANINSFYSKNNKIDTPFSIAMLNHNYDIMDYFISNGLDFKTGNQGKILLRNAAEDGDVSSLEYLVNKLKIKVNDYNKKEISALTYAVLHNRSSAVEFLVEHGAKPSTVNLWTASSEANENIVSYLLDKGVKVRKKGVTTLMAACHYWNYWDKRFIKIKSYAASDSRKKIITMLLEHGDKIDAQEEHGWTAIMFATAEGNEELVSFLIEKGADLNIKTKDGKTVLDITSNQKLKNIIIDAMSTKSKS